MWEPGRGRRNVPSSPRHLGVVVGLLVTVLVQEVVCREKRCNNNTNTDGSHPPVSLTGARVNVPWDGAVVDVSRAIVITPVNLSWRVPHLALSRRIKLGARSASVRGRKMSCVQPHKSVPHIAKFSLIGMAVSDAIVVHYLYNGVRRP
ncbi:hypothetical protein Pmani_008910 [Petrolisthes manimaculis]|uniref:Secreted protein n=1 Tax=Petrolisthes manimaculis TaxID=1843537 RepID=A0AAE1Q5W3_9EUCA|nr:hypothetical protein Pmani_008910 [Petrolisthes manimaculis]